MPKPLEMFVKQVMAEHDRGAKAFRAIHHGWDALKTQSDRTWWRRKSTRAHIVWENTVNKAIELFAEDPHHKVVPHYDTVSFVFEDAVLLRFKKADIALRASNISTPLADLFHDHEVDLFGYEGLQRVEAVYVLNQFETAIIWSGIAANQNDAHLWHFELTDTPIAVPTLPLYEKSSPTTASLAKLKGKPQAKPGTKAGE